MRISAIRLLGWRTLAATSDRSGYTRLSRKHELDDTVNADFSEPQLASLPPTRTTKAFLFAAGRYIAVFVIGALISASVARLNWSGSFCETDLRHTASASVGYFSPAAHLAEYNQKTTFSRSWPPDVTIYQGPPTPERDAAWELLYNKVGITSLSKAEAEQLPYQTLPYADDPEHFPVTLEVFHDLHCLNHFRHIFWAKALNISRDPALDPILHLDHCIDVLRQSVMCNADLAPLGWSWVEDGENSHWTPRSAVPHMCRDWNAIHKWAEGRQGPGPDTSARPPTEYLNIPGDGM